MGHYNIIMKKYSTNSTKINKMRFICTTLIIALSISITAQTEFKKEFHENGKIAIEWSVKSGDTVKHGPYKEYYENGQLAYSSNYINSLEEGSYTSYHENGSISEEGISKKGLPHGIYKYYSKDGVLIEKVTYELGKLNGVSYDYYKNGEIEYKITYKDGRENGPFEDYYENGQLAAKGTIKPIWHKKYEYYIELEIGEFEEYLEDGRLVQKGVYEIDYEEYESIKAGLWIINEYYDNGQLKSTGSFLDDEYHGEHKEYHENGRLMGVLTFNNGNAEGLGKEYFENGQLKYLGKWQNGDKTGIHKEYHKNGNLHELITYVNNKRDGWYELYHNNGKPREKGNILQGSGWGSGSNSKIGEYTEWEYYNYDGQVKTKITTVDGDYHGEYIMYNESGSIREKGMYKNDEMEGEWYFNYPEKNERFKNFYENGEALYGKKVSSINDSMEDEWYKIVVKNKCHKPVQVAVRIKNLNGEWESLGWLNLEPYEKGKIGETENRIFYFTAHTFDFSIKWRGDKQKTIRGDTFGFKEKTIPSSNGYGDYNFSLTCGN